jgi:hypothetical protein
MSQISYIKPKYGSVLSKHYNRESMLNHSNLEKIKSNLKSGSTRKKKKEGNILTVDQWSSIGHGVNTTLQIKGTQAAYQTKEL